VAVSEELKPPPGSRSGLKYPLGLLKSFIYIIVFQDGGDGRGYRNVWHVQNNPGGPLELGGLKFITAICNCHSLTGKRLFGCGGYVTAVAVGQRQQFYSGVGIFIWYHLSSTPRDIRIQGPNLNKVL
jgi:hypothetical protein